MQKEILWNDNWFFQKTGELPQEYDLAERFEEITLPHTWNAVDGQDGGNDYYRGTCMYAKRFIKPETEACSRILLRFEGAAMTAEVFLNGKQIVRHEGGYAAFCADITDALKDENLLCVRVDNGINDKVYPQKADFTFYGGLYRDVKLIIVPEIHFEREKDGMPGIKVTPVVNAAKRTAELTLESWQNTDGRVRFTVLAPKGVGAEYWQAKRKEKQGAGNKTGIAAFTDEKLAETDMETVAAALSETERQAEAAQSYAAATLTLSDVHLWNGRKDPYLYLLKAELLTESGESKDTVYLRFGCRSFSFDREKGFFLNGRSYPLRGVSRHQDRMGVGNALTEAMHDEDMALILEIGANTVRLAHYQQAQYFYDLCDENGLVVWAEIPYITQHMPGGRENTFTQMRELITQCHHHASIVCWGLSNEITVSGGVTEDLLENHRLLNKLCHGMDATRPTAIAHAFMLETDSPLIDIADIGSYNLYFGWYLGELEQNDSFFDEYHAEYPDRIIGFSEYGADANPQYQSASPERSDYTESYQCVYHEHILNCIGARPYLWATYVWNLFDFAADGRDEGGRHGVNQKGLVTMDRKLKKDAFFLYKAYWSSEAFVHICGRRFVERTGEETEIRVYSNQSAVSLYVDGNCKQEQTGEHIFCFKIPLTGEHTICAKAGGCKDEIRIQKVDEENASYTMLKKEEVVNWFDRDKLDAACFSIEDTMGEITAVPEGAALIGRMIEKVSESRGDVAQSASGNKNLQQMMAGMKLSALLRQAGDALSADEIQSLNRALQKIKKPEKKKRLILNADSRLSQIFSYEEAKQIFDTYLPGMRKRVETQPATLGFSLRKLVLYAKGAVPENVLDKIEEAFGGLELYTAGANGYNAEQPLTTEAAECIKEAPYTAIRPGRAWRDTKGVRIQAHGGALFYENGIYYWYGENKDRTDGKCAVWTWGIRAYASKDLYNWEDLGLIIEPNLTDAKSGLYPQKHVDRPHIVKNDVTGKYVCWIKQSGEEACFLILQADAFTGPYSIVKEQYRPLGKKVGDFDIRKDERAGKCYLFMDADHEGIVGMELAEDFLAVTREVSVSYEGLHAPFCREGVALFERNGKKYMLTSGMSGYIPNKSDAAVSDGWDKPFVSIGNPHVNDDTNASFNSQISQVFQVPGKKELYIAIADRWVPGWRVNARRASLIERSIASHYDPEKYQVTPEEQQEMMDSPMLESANTSIADYVWLPLRFEGERVCIDWKDEWRTEDYE